jgi:methylated-DNA-[protein]-cysteine S-methyltransferase
VRIQCSPRGVTGINFVANARDGRASDPSERAAFAAEHPWVKALLEELQHYFAGRPVSFTAIPLDLEDQPQFWRRVQETCARIPYGATLTYAQLAAKAGKSAAVRAAGSAMSHNPIPILIPCHRVLSSGGGLGGYSAPGGVELKRRLLEMEQRAEKTPR